MAEAVEKWKCLWMATATAQLVEMVLDPNYKPQTGEEKLYCQQLTYIYKVLLNTVLKSSLRAILHRGDAETVPKMWEEMVSKAKQSTEAKHYSKKIFDYLSTVTVNDSLCRGTNKDFITHWCEQHCLYEEYYDELSLTDTIKISLLQKAVSSTLHLEVVKTQTNTLSRLIDGVGEIDFAGY
jgi:hypothetical protein